jgi:uncharacterized protein YhbP (UPF0306 family)
MKRVELVAGLLASENTLALATGGAETPQVAPLFYLPADGLGLYWFSAANSAHSRALRKDSAAAVTVYHATDQWQEIRGVQMRGTVSVVTASKDRRRVALAYAERFHLGPSFALVMRRSRLYLFRPTWIRYIDNSKRFGFKFEVTLPAV